MIYGVTYHPAVRNEGQLMDVEREPEALTVSVELTPAVDLLVALFAV